MTEPDLTAALALDGLDATLKLYRDWAATYDSGFAIEMAFNLPHLVADAFVAAGGAGPVLDIGAGTGLLAQNLRSAGFADPIDGLDFSAEMLARARKKAIYRDLIRADVTQPLPLPRAYNGVTSSGTFTFGHVGPQAVGPLLAIALPGALFALSINQKFWVASGFEPAVDGLQQAGRIRDLRRIDVAIYGTAAAAIDPDHANDRAWITLFRAT